MTAHGNASTDLHLESHPFFRGLPPTFLAALAKHAYSRSFDTGDLLTREGDPADEFLLVFSGKVALEVVLPGQPRTTIQTVGPGEVIGWSWLCPPHRWRLDARALKPTRTLGLAAGHLRTMLQDDPATGYEFLLRLLPVIAERLENTRLQLLDIHGV